MLTLVEAEKLFHTLEYTDLLTATGLVPAFFSRRRSAEVRTSLFHHVAYVSVFLFIQPESGVCRAGFNLEVKATVPESNHLLIAVRASVVDRMLAVLSLTFDHVIAGGVVL
jgi:hypothetical protein